MTKLYFAPLQGFTESSYRKAHFLCCGKMDQPNSYPGIEAYYTPFLRVEKGGARSKEVRDLIADIDLIHSTRKAFSDSGESFYKVIPQIICRDVSEFKILVEAIQKINRDTQMRWESQKDVPFPQIDINMGCPFPMQAKAGRGSGILPRINAVREILEETANYSPLKFSVKMRLGYTSPEEGLALLPLLNDASLTHITMHPRVGSQQYKGALDIDSFQKFYEGCRHPLIFNGDITSYPQTESIQKSFPEISGVMVGRGLLANPTLSLPYPVDTLLKIHDIILEDYLGRLQGDAQVLDKIRPFWTYPVEAAQTQAHIAEALPKRVLKKLMKAKKLDEYTRALEEIPRP